MSDNLILGGPCRLCGRRNHMPLSCAEAEAKEHESIQRILRDAFTKIKGDPEVTTKVRITNIVEEGGAHSNGDVVIHGLAEGRVILAPGESYEEWLKHSDLPEPVTITERWPSQAKK